MLREGDEIGRRYRIVSMIGRGGMSQVYLASDKRMQNKLWAIKAVKKDATDKMGRAMTQSLAAERDILARLSHPMIVNIADVVDEGDDIYVVMDYVEGETLDSVVRRDGPQSEADVQKWALQLCDVLGYLHAQNPPIVFRDLKPSNIMLRPDGYVKVIDFGIAREYKDDGNRDTTTFGSEGYAPPEQYGRGQTDARSDIYSLGATMWQLLAGTVPPVDVEHARTDVRDYNPKVGEGFADVIIPRCTQPLRENRYQNCDELAADLEVYTELTSEYRGRQKRKVRNFVLCLVAAIVFAVAGFVCTGARVNMIENEIGNRMTQADSLRADDPEAAAADYVDIINTLKSDDIDAYIGLIDCFKQDQDFTPAEKAQLDAVYRSHLTELKASPRFSELSYEIGRLYWYFYSYGESATVSHEDNQVTRVRASAEYFENAANDPEFALQSKASIYNDIAQFHVNIDTAENTDDAADMYRPYWDSLNNLLTSASAETNDTVQLDGYSLVVNAMETYLDDFKAAGVPRTDVEALFSRTDVGLSTMSFDNDARGVKDQRRDALKSRLDDQVRRKIDTVYTTDGEGGS